MKPSFLTSRIAALLILSFNWHVSRAEDFPISLQAVEARDESVAAEYREGSGLAVSLAAGAKGMPGASVVPEGEVFPDFSRFSRIEAVIRNTGPEQVPVSLRVDNPGHWKDAPWNTESIRLQPGETGTLAVFFGYANGGQKSFPLDPAKIVQLLFFAPGGEKERSFVVESVKVTGTAGEDPAALKNSGARKPEGGILFGKGREATSTRQLSAMNHATADLSESGEEIVIRFDRKDQRVTLRPEAGRWDLRDAGQMEVHLTNTGAGNLVPRIQLHSNSGSTTIRETARVPAGASRTVVVEFAPPNPWNAADYPPGEEHRDPLPSGTKWSSKAVSGISFHSEASGNQSSFTVSGIKAVPATTAGKVTVVEKPPFEGEWVMTLDETFDGAGPDETVWNVHTANHWDKKTAFSRDNVILKNGAARLRFEHRESRHNDEADGELKSYTSGFLDTFGKWTQRYGYFEARMKLPRSPGLWPAFWTMPDRGPQEAPRWKREQTSNGGMEFDIMEYLSSWGPYRYNVAFHWDGYGKNHKSSGTSGIYMKPDEEGFITAGLLWLPGKAAYFCNGELVGKWESDRICSVPSILMFTHVSGGWDNEPLDNAQLPDDFVIDHVRCWQRSDLVEKP